MKQQQNRNINRRGRGGHHTIIGERDYNVLQSHKNNNKTKHKLHNIHEITTKYKLACRWNFVVSCVGHGVSSQNMEAALCQSVKD